MSSTLDINSNFSDSEDDQDYVPPTIAEYEDEICEEEFESSPKKIKLDIKEPDIDKISTDSIWRNFLKGVDSSSYNVGQRKTISAGLNVSHQIESDSSAINAAQDKTTNFKKYKCEVITPEKAIISEKSLKNVTLSIERDKNENTSDEIAYVESIDGKDNSSEIKLVRNCQNGSFEINVAKKNSLNSILGAIANKDKKMTVFEKSLSDWKNFKQQEGIGKDLEIYNKSKNGYIERKRFLERSDLRLFETEKSIRLSGRKK